ncbi:MAG: LytTR family DNA-binding domain-containing protein [Spirosomaceae bacterium]|jgi:DNA-binding LytR/AlgR family response regulator|nr:LytTR family DNA-binding domain-containing protein [Spirosomataceae bacterium]
MKTLIVEDEKPAQEHLERLLHDIEPHAQVLAKLDSVSSAVRWLSAQQADLIFLDIHLADDLSFKIFEQIKVRTPVIFTTAYDQYALRAFKVNSVDYLLKPIDKEELANAINKFKQSQVAVPTFDVEQLLATLHQPAKTYQERFVVTRGERVMSITTEQIAYFEGEDRYVYLTKKDGARFIVDYKLSELEELLNPRQFYRLNRSFIARFESIQHIYNLSKSRVKVELTPAAQREIIVSSENTQDFKGWLNQ